MKNYRPSKKDLLPKIDIPIGEIYDFARDRIVEYSKLPKSKEQKLKNSGRIDILNEFMWWLRHYEKGGV